MWNGSTASTFDEEIFHFKCITVFSRVRVGGLIFLDPDEGSVRNYTITVCHILRTFL